MVSADAAILSAADKEVGDNLLVFGGWPWMSPSSTT